MTFDEYQSGPPRPWDADVEWIGVDTTPSGYAVGPAGLFVPQSLVAKRKPVALDLFAGCGEMSLGLEMAGIDVVAAVEWSVDAFATYVLNLGSPLGGAVSYSDGKQDELHRWFERSRRKRKGELVANEPAPGEWGWWGWNRRNLLGFMGLPPDDTGGCRGFFLGDIRECTGELLLELADVDEFDLLVGGPPRQGLSTANAKACVADPRNAMLWEYLRLVEELRPRAFVIENVPPLLTAGKGGLFLALRDRAIELGYSVVANVLDAADYGVPQRRRRAFVVGTDDARHGCAVQFPAPSTWAIGMVPGGKPWDMRPEGDCAARHVRFNAAAGRFEELQADDAEMQSQAELFETAAGARS